MLTNVARIQIVLAGLAKLLPMAQAAETAANQDLLTWIQQNENGMFQFSQAALAQLNALGGAYSADFLLVTDLINYGSAISSWAQNEDQRAAYNLPLLPYPAMPADIAAAAAAQNISLAPADPPAPLPAVQGESFLAPGGFVAVIGPQVTPAMYLSLNGDTVPNGATVTDPAGISFTKHVVPTPFGAENWYSLA